MGIHAVGKTNESLEASRRQVLLLPQRSHNLCERPEVRALDDELVLLSSIAILRPSERVDAHFLAATLKEPTNKDQLKNYVTGAAIPRIVLADFKRFPIVIPPVAVQRDWTSVVAPMTRLCWTLLDQTENLRATRDLLLPRLLSGKIDLEDVEPAT